MSTLQKILVVDDEPDLQMLMLQKFRAKVKSKEYEFLFAENGKEALETLSIHTDLSLVLSDINMPKMDGLTLLSEIQQLERTDIRTIMVSAYGDMENIRTAMNRGAYDFVTKPIDFKDLETTVEKTLREIRQFENVRMMEQQLESLNFDLDMAARIQQKILHQEFPVFPDDNRFDIFANRMAVKQVGGDFYISLSMTMIILPSLSVTLPEKVCLLQSIWRFAEPCSKRLDQKYLIQLNAFSK